MRGEVPLISSDLVDLVTDAVPAHLTLTRRDGSLVSHVVWIEYDGRQLLMSSRRGSWKSRALRARPQVALSVMDPTNQWRRLSITGKVVNVLNDHELRLIDRLSLRYTGVAYDQRGDRDIIVIEPTRIRSYCGRAR